MLLKLSDIVTRADELIKQATDLLQTQKYSQVSHSSYVDEGSFRSIRAAILSFLLGTFGKEHPYYEDIINKAKVGYSSDLENAIGVMKAARNEIAGGWLIQTKTIAAAEIFADFLEMAEYLLSEGYKDASAVIVGSVLEEHLRQLCQANSIDTELLSGGKKTPKKADAMNADLAKAGVYGKLEQKSVTAWLDLRNQAAHGKYSAYNTDQVRMMCQGVLEFANRVKP